MWLIVYRHIRDTLGGGFTETVKAPDLPPYRLADMYHSCVDEEIKAIILKMFSKPSHLRVVIATVAFGMGIDCKNVHQIVHVGAPEDIESYIRLQAVLDGMELSQLLFSCKLKILGQSIDEELC